MNKNQKANDFKTNRGLGSKINHSEQTHITKQQFIAGDVSDKYPVPLSNGKTIVFAKSKGM